MKAEDKLVKARVRLQKDNPFFAYLVMNLKFKEDKTISSIGVDDNGNCVYNSKWISKLDDEQLKGVLTHEVLHLVLQHFPRGENKEHEIYNIACDLVINYILQEEHFHLPQGLVPYGSSFDFGNGLVIRDLDKKYADEVYNEIMGSGKVKKQKLIVACANGRFDKHIYSDSKKGQGDNGKQAEQKKKKWNKILSEASVYAKQQGNLPRGMERLVDLMLNEKVNWKQLLYKYITRELPFDYTYSKPSKKSISTGIYMPSILRENINVVVSIDTSGSIGQNELTEFLDEIINVAKSFNNVKMTLIVCDAEIQDVYTIENGNIETIRNLKIRGGGGTSHIPIYRYIKENLPMTKFVINFTDGYTNFPDEEEVRTIWVITENGVRESSLPFGEVIKLG